VQAFLAAGHVCAVMGYEEYPPLAAKYRVPIVVTGFEPLDILHGILMAVQQLESGRAEVENQYARSVRPEGNQPAQELMRKVFKVVSRQWRGVGEIPQSGLGLADEYAAFDAEQKFGVADRRVAEPADCIAGQVLQGLKKPPECPAFGGEMHAGTSARRDDGFERRRVRGLLPVSEACMRNLAKHRTSNIERQHPMSSARRIWRH
jgi:hydrogenase expression/formation protein HypD